MTLWLAVIGAGVGCYLLKLAGLSIPERFLEHPVVERVADFIPVALLSALVAVQVFSSGSSLVIDARLAGLAAAFVLLLLRAPFLVVVFGAALVAALLRRSDACAARSNGRVAQSSPRKCSSPTVRPGWSPIARSPVSTPGVNDARSIESWRIVSVSPRPPSSTSW